MKMSVGKRILMFFHWLFSLLICAGLVAYVAFPDFTLDLYHKLEGKISGRNLKIIGGALLAIYLVLVIAQVCIIFKRRKRSDRGFITVDSSETGRTRIAISAIEQMVRQSVHSIDGISDMKINIDSKDDAITIFIAASIVNGCHVPTITMNMQNAIRKFVEMNCGVAVSAVSISINSVTNAPDTQRKRRLLRGKQSLPNVTPAAPAAQPATAAPEFTPAPDIPAAAEAPADEAPAYEAPAYEEPAYEAPAAYEPSTPAFTPAEEPEKTFNFDPNYKPTLTLDPFGDQGGASDSDAPADDE